MKKNITKISLIAMSMLPLFIALPAMASAPASWNTTGSYGINVNYLSVDYPETLVLTQSGSNITGTSLDTVPPSSPFTVTGGSVSGNNIDIDASQGSLSIHMTGTIALNGSMSGTWADITPGTRVGTWVSTSGAAIPLGLLDAEDFGVVNYDTGLGFLKGYSAGFGLTDAVFTDATSVVVRLYSAGDVLLQTNTFNTANIPLITGAQISSPFDVSGTFAYATDGYWVNVREAQYGQSVGAVKVVATVTLSNGKVLIAENTTLAGDPTTIYPIITPPVVSATSTISGMKYNDRNRNGKKGINEPGLSGWVIRLSLNNPDGSVTLIATTSTDVNGNYSFTNVATGTYDVRETHQKGWKRMSKNPKDIVITASSTVTGVDFGNAIKQKKEKEDDDRDDNRHDQSGYYFSHNDRSNYESDQNKGGHNRR